VVLEYVLVVVDDVVELDPVVVVLEVVAVSDVDVWVVAVREVVVAVEDVTVVAVPVEDVSVVDHNVEVVLPFPASDSCVQFMSSLSLSSDQLELSFSSDQVALVRSSLPAKAAATSEAMKQAWRR